MFFIVLDARPFYISGSSNALEHFCTCISLKHAVRRLSHHVRTKRRNSSSPMLILLYPTAMLHKRPQDNWRFNTWYRYDGGLLNLRRLWYQRLTSAQHILGLQYVDNNAVTGKNRLWTISLLSTISLHFSKYQENKVSCSTSPKYYLTRFWYYYIWYISWTSREFFISSEPFIKQMYLRKGCRT